MIDPASADRPRCFASGRLHSFSKGAHPVQHGLLASDDIGREADRLPRRKELALRALGAAGFSLPATPWLA